MSILAMFYIIHKHLQMAKWQAHTSLLSQSLDCYWQTNNKKNTEHKSQKYTHKHNMNQRK